MADWESTFSRRSGFTLRASVSLLTQNIAANTSTVSVAFLILETSAQTSFSGFPADNSWAMNVDGTAYSGNYTFDARPAGLQSWLQLSTTLVVPHNADGTKTFNTTASSSSGVLGSASIGTQAFVLPRIPRGPKVETAPGVWAQSLARVETSPGVWQTALVRVETSPGIWQIAS
jgi:hypothetical protein